MSQTLGKVGNTLIVPIPAAFAGQLHWDENTEVICTIADGKLIIAPVDSPVYDLDQLVTAITPENRHDEMSKGPAVGNEAW